MACGEVKDDGDWDFLNRHLPDKETMERHVLDGERVDAFRFAPSALKFIENTEKISVF